MMKNKKLANINEDKKSSSVIYNKILKPQKDYAFVREDMQTHFNELKSYLSNAGKSFNKPLSFDRYFLDDLRALEKEVEEAIKVLESQAKTRNINIKKSEEDLVNDFMWDVINSRDDEEPKLVVSSKLKTTMFVLKRFCQDFEWVLNDICNEFKALCREDNIQKLNDLIEKHEWIVGAITQNPYSNFNNDEGIYDVVINNNNIDILETLIESDKYFDNYKVPVLINTVKAEKIDFIKLLFKKCEYKASELKVLTEKNYFDKNEEIMTLLSNKIDNLGDGTGKYFEGKYYYLKNDYKKAQKLFESAEKNTSFETKIDSIYYKGLCLKHLGNKEEAKKIFQEVTKIGEENTTEETKKITENASKQLDSIDNEEKVKEKISRYKEKFEHELEQYESINKKDLLGKYDFSSKVIEPVKNFANELEKIEQVKKDLPILKIALDQARYIDLNKFVPEEVLEKLMFAFLESSDDNNNNEDENLRQYKEANQFIDDTVKLLADIQNDGIFA